MPTPFMHLEIAERILAHEVVEDHIRRMAQHYYPSYYLGSVAPDYQTICDVPRERSHFYHLPPDDNNNGYTKMFSIYPLFGQPKRLQPEHAVFIAAYCTHLILDLAWFREILVPFFVEPPKWESNQQRFVAHNTLLTFLDKQAVSSLPDSAAATLSLADPDNWLPFAHNQELVEWRDLLVEQLQPGTPLRTIEIYAERLFMKPEIFASNLEKPDWMDENLFSRVPVDEISHRLTVAVKQSAIFLASFLGDFR